MTDQIAHLLAAVHSTVLSPYAQSIAADKLNIETTFNRSKITISPLEASIAVNVGNISTSFGAVPNSEIE